MIFFKICLIFTLAIFYGCSSKNSIESDANAVKSYETIMKITPNCSPCSRNSKNYVGKINGATYTSDIAVLCCPQMRKIDTSSDLKKVYIHAVRDLGYEQKVIHAKGENYVQKRRFDTLFFYALKKELTARGILVVSSQTSPYTLRVDFTFTKFSGAYDMNSLNSTLFGDLAIKNINYEKHVKISTRQNVRDLNSDEFDLYMDLLVKQVANKVADEIGDFKG